MKRTTIQILLCSLALMSLLAGCSEPKKDAEPAKPEGAPAMSSTAQSQMNAAQQADAAQRAANAPR